MAVGGAGGAPNAEVLRNGTWSSTSPVAIAPFSTFDAVSCPTKATCLAAGDYAGPMSQPTTLVETYKAATWTRDTSATVGSYAGVTLNSISCTTAQACVAVGLYADHPGPVGAFEETLHHGTWSNEVIYDNNMGHNPTISLSGVSCRSSGAAVLCWAVGNDGDEFFFDSTSGSGWTGPQDIDTTQRLTGISCSSASTCMAVDSAGNAVSLSSGVWTTPVSADGSDNLSAVSCPTRTFCVAVDTAGNAVTET